MESTAIITNQPVNNGNQLLASFWFHTLVLTNTGLFIMFSVITNICNKKTKGPTLMELFTATGKLKKFFWQLDMLDVCTTCDMAHIDMIFKLLPHTHQHGCIDILHCCACVARTWISYRCVPCHPWCTHRTSRVVKKTFSVFLWLWTIPSR
jgi:hypothetical protein